MKKHIKKLLAVVIIIVMASGLIPLSAGAASVVNITGKTVAAAQSEIQKAIDDLGGAADTVTVRGNISGAAAIMTLNVRANATVIWEADYRGTANPVVDLTGSGEFQVVAGGRIANTNLTGSVMALRVKDSVSVVIDGGTVEAILGSAIEGAGPGVTVTVEKNSIISNRATSNLRPVINMTDISNVGKNVVVNGGIISANADGDTAYGYVIQTYGIVIINDGEIFTSGGYGRGINLTGEESVAIVNGGRIFATGRGGVAISTATTAGMVVTRTKVIVNGGLVAAIGTGNSWAIHTTGSASTVKVHGGCVFALGDRFTGSSNSVIYTEKATAGAGFTVHDGDGTLIAWNRQAGALMNHPFNYTSGSDFADHIITNPSTPPAPSKAEWDKRPPGYIYDGMSFGDKSFDGISYDFGIDNHGYIPLPEVTVHAPCWIRPIVVPLQMPLPANITGGSGTVRDSDHNEIVGIRQLVRYGGSISFTIEPNSLIDFIYEIRVYDEGVANKSPSNIYNVDVVSPYTFTDVTDNYIIRVIFGQRSNTDKSVVTAVSGTGGRISGSGVVEWVANNGSYGPVIITPANNHRILDVTVNNISVTSGGPPYYEYPDHAEYTLTGITDRMLVVATFIPLSHEITATISKDSPVGSGSIDPTGDTSGKVVVAHDGSQVIKIEAEEDYRICDVRVDGHSVLDESGFTGVTYSAGNLLKATYTFSNVDRNHVIEVTFISIKREEYDITVGHNEGGIVSKGLEEPWEDITEPVKVEHGYSVAFTILPEEGFRIGSVRLDGRSVTSQVFEGVYPLGSVDGPHEIFVTFVPLGDPGDGGQDTGSPQILPPPVDPGPGDVSHMLHTENHIQYVRGVGSNRRAFGVEFQPARDVTRAEVAQMFFNLLLEQNVQITKRFPDEPASAWHERAVHTMASLGIARGYADGSFRPEGSVTRAEFVAMAVRFAKSLPPAGHITFRDVPVRHWAYEYIDAAVQFGWIAGYSDGSFQPSRYISRAEAVTIVNSMLGRAADRGYVDGHPGLARFSDVPQSHWAYYDIMEAYNAHDFYWVNGAEHWVE